MALYQLNHYGFLNHVVCLICFDFLSAHLSNFCLLPRNDYDFLMTVAHQCDHMNFFYLEIYVLSQTLTYVLSHSEIYAPSQTYALKQTLIYVWKQTETYAFHPNDFDVTCASNWIEIFPYLLIDLCLLICAEYQIETCAFFLRDFDLWNPLFDFYL